MAHGSRRLILGTVQLGMAYGVANVAGRPSLELAQKIVSEAIQQGVSSFDTAVAYGDSETVLGQCLSRAVYDCEPYIISKLPPALSILDIEALSDIVSKSLKRLKIKKLGCLMLHREEHLALLDDPSFIVGLRGLKEQGLISQFGCSVYSPEKAVAALKHEAIDVVQLPASLFDRRFEAVDVYDLADKESKILHLRSALLQGALCMEHSLLPTHLKPLAPWVESFHSLCKKYSYPPASLAIAWLLERFPKAFVLFGAENPRQVMENTTAIDTIILSSSLKNALEDIIPPQVAELLNPALWRV